MAVDWLNVAVSFLSGAGGAAILDAYLKPRQARRRAAVVLRAEVETNREHLIHRLPRTEGMGIWKEFVLPTVAFHVATSDVGELPIPVAQAVITVYHSYARVLQLYDTHSRAFEEALGKNDVDGRYQRNFEATRETLREGMQAAIADCDSALSLLETEAAISLLPWRRPRRLPPTLERVPAR